MTLTQALQEAGFSHRRRPGDHRSGREILNEDGEVIGRLTSDECWRWAELGFPLNVAGKIDRELVEEVDV